MQGDISELLAVFKSVKKNSCPDYFNFHCHTIYSDGSLDPVELINIASKNRLIEISITDHHSQDAYSIIRNHIEHQLDLDIYTPRVWTGIEISCTLKKCLVHVLGYGFQLKHKSLTRYSLGESVSGEYLNADYVVNCIHEAGGLAFLAHPARYRIGYERLIEFAVNADFDGLETWYDYDFNPIWQPTPIVCEKIKSLAISNGLLTSCGTDSHGYCLDGR